MPDANYLSILYILTNDNSNWGKNNNINNINNTRNIEIITNRVWSVALLRSK